MRKLSRIPSERNVNSMHLWWRKRNPLRTAFNFLIIYSCRYLPSLTLKNALYRAIGIKVGRDVSVGVGAVFDFFYPELIEVGGNSVIGYNTVILAHEFLVEELRTGPVKIGKNVLISANCTILPGVTIGDGAKISAMSLVNSDVPAGGFYGGVPARPLKN